MLRTLFLFFTLIMMAGFNQSAIAETQHSTESHDEGEAHDEHEATEDHEGDEEHAGEHDEHGGEEEAGSVHLKPEQMKMADIIVEPVVMTDVAASVRAPGEVKLNAYRTIKVTPRINAQVIKRHAYLGDEVSKAQVLVTLSSVEMAEAQGELLLDGKEWQRVKELGRKVVSERRYITAKVGYEKSYANVAAFGMNESDIKDLLTEKRRADGSFQLVAQQAGRILHDEFIVGEFIEAGYNLMVISDESSMWVEARVAPSVASNINIGNSVEIFFDQRRLAAKVIQLHHTLDEITRTSAVRIEVGNENDRLHAGMFVTALITTADKNKALQVPEAAVMRSSDGDWQVMVEQDEAGEFKGVEVEVKSIRNGMAVIEGIASGTRVVTQGAFFVQSELAKGGFEIHNH